MKMAISRFADDSGVPEVRRRIQVVRVAIKMYSAEVHGNRHLLYIEFATFYSFTEFLKLLNDNENKNDVRINYKPKIYRVAFTAIPIFGVLSFTSFLGFCWLPENTF